MAVSLLGQTTKCLGNTYLQRTSLLFNTIESWDIISAGNFSMNLKIRNHHACSIVLQEETLWDDANPAKTGFSWSPNQLSRRLGVAWLPCLSCLLVCLVLLAAWLHCEDNYAMPLIRSPHSDTNNMVKLFVNKILCTFGIWLWKEKKIDLPLTLCCKSGPI